MRRILRILMGVMMGTGSVFATAVMPNLGSTRFVISGVVTASNGSLCCAWPQALGCLLSGFLITKFKPIGDMTMFLLELGISPSQHHQSTDPFVFNR